MQVQTIGVINLNTNDMSNTRVWKVRFQELGNKKICETKHTGPQDYDYVVKHFGLEDPGVIWYEVTEITEKV